DDVPRRAALAEPPVQQLLPGRLHRSAPVVTGDALDLFARAEEHRYALVQRGRLDIEDALPAIGSGTAGLLDDEGHGVGLVHQAQLAGLLRLARIPGVHEQTATGEDAVHVGHHRGDPAHVVVLAQRAFLAGQQFADVA